MTKEEMMKKEEFRIIGFAGPKFSGKDSAAQGLFGLNAALGANLFRQQMMAGPAKRIAEMAFGYSPVLIEDPGLKESPLEQWPHICPRQLVIDVANWYRTQYGGEVWARRWEQIARANNAEWGCHVITDVRFPEETKMIRRNKGCIIYIQRDKAEEALVQKVAAGDQMAANVSESHYGYIKKIAHATIENNGAMHQLQNSVVAVTRNFYGHWRMWPEIHDLVAACSNGTSKGGIA